MQAIEFSGKVSGNKISLPASLREKIKDKSEVRVIVLYDNSDSDWKSEAIRHFFNDETEKDAVYDTL